MTTGGPDTSDVYEEEINPANPLAISLRRPVARNDGPQRGHSRQNGHRFRRERKPTSNTRATARSCSQGCKAYVFSLPYFDQVLLADQTYKMVTAHNLGEMKQALAMLQLMMQKS